MTLEVVAYTPAGAEEWDAFCRKSVNGTFLHSRLFLGYHGDRFHDLSVSVRDGARLIALLPAARDPNDEKLVVSHPGTTYGGFVHDGYLTGERMLEAFEAVGAFMAQSGSRRLLYKAIPHSYARVPAGDDLYALFRLGARRVRCDLSSAVDLAHRLPVSERRRRALRKSQRYVEISSDLTHIDGLWEVLSENLSRKHNAQPVHSRAEIGDLLGRFPDEIAVRVALVDNEVVAGVVLFLTSRVWHAQYIASSEVGYSTCALDTVFETIIAEATVAGCRYFDFGTSNENAGTVLNTGLYRFKSEFGGGE
ncbi:GNAT family N-acetyltransferase [Pleomorphomonas sp. PLEO]|uniref:GNAT family N-acetyltransferase n=1 Tax=Pleomorphomonas sp. PLEO TaxID=3239306 RepID=UPI00351E16C2